MNKPKLTKDRIILAFAVAVVADAIQIPLGLLELTGFLFVPSFVVDTFIDFVAAGITCLLLGFHWALLPSIALEGIPGADLLPTWIGCVAFVVWRRKVEESKPKPVVDVQAVTVVSQRPALPGLVPPALPAGPVVGSAQIQGDVETRLRQLGELLAKALISQAEHDAKRREILAGM